MGAVAFGIGNLGCAYLNKSARHILPEELADVYRRIIRRVDIRRVPFEVIEGGAVELTYHPVYEVLPVAFQHFARFYHVVVFGSYLLSDSCPEEHRRRFYLSLIGKLILGGGMVFRFFVYRPNVGDGFSDGESRCS